MSGATVHNPGRSRGQAVAEFALIAPVMLGLVLLAVDFGRMFYTYIAVNNAAREATYIAGVHAADDPFTVGEYRATVTTAAVSEANVQGQAGEGSLSVSDPVCFTPGSTLAIDCHVASHFAPGIGNQVTVTVSQPFTFLTPFIGELIGGQLDLTASATGPILNPIEFTIIEDPDATPTPTPSPSPTPTASPTPEPGESPEPSASPSPAPSPSPPPQCEVPDFYHTYWNDIGSITVWHDEGFTGELIDDTGGHKIQHQTLTAHSIVLCSSDMTVSNT